MLSGHHSTPKIHSKTHSSTGQGDAQAAGPKKPEPKSTAIIEKVDVALRSYFMTPASKTKLTNPEVQDAIGGLKFSNASGPKRIPNRALNHLPPRAVSLLALIFNAILVTHHFPKVWKHARVNSVLKPGKDPALPSSYRPISLLYTIDKLFENILLSRILQEVKVHDLLLNEQLGFRHRHCTSLLLARLVESPGILAKRG